MDTDVVIPIVGTPDDDRLVGTNGRDEIIGLRGNDKLYGKNGNDVLEGRIGNDHLFGGDGDDILRGGQGRDRLNGGGGNDTIEGGASIDRFIFATNEAFSSDDIGVDTILNFQPDLRPDEAGNEGDLILLDKTTFTALESNSGISFSNNNDFEIVNSDGEVANSGASIIYSEASGNLFYNTTLFATLDGSPTITEDNFQIR